MTALANRQRYHDWGSGILTALPLGSAITIWVYLISGNPAGLFDAIVGLGFAILGLMFVTLFDRSIRGEQA
ncbi:MAG: hypothetical protein WC343_10885 [Bacilli bacterium]|jgi:hypothetical protein